MLGQLGIHVGHWTNETARTGCTVLLLPPGTTASAEVRGGAPASRELDLLAPHRTVQHADAIVLTGGSAFGLASAQGVMRYCEERERGVPTPAGVVPIVPALGLFDLAVGDATVRPGAEQGYAACQSATDELVTGSVGAGCGATVGKIHGPQGIRGAGIAAATRRSGELIVTCLVAVNAFGDIDSDGTLAASLADRAGNSVKAPFGNTTIGVIATNARLDKNGCLLACQGAHDGLARAIAPPHTGADGDAFIGVATKTVDADIDTVRLLAMTVTTDAIKSLA